MLIAECYLSEKDKKVVTVTAKSESNQLLCVTRLKVKVQSGDQGAQGGLIFLIEEDPSKLGEERLKAFESWTAEDYKSEEKRWVTLGHIHVCRPHNGPGTLGN